MEQGRDQTVALRGLGVPLGQISLLGAWSQRSSTVWFFFWGHFMKWTFHSKMQADAVSSWLFLSACHWTSHPEMCQPQLHHCCIPGGCFSHFPTLPFGQLMMFSLKFGMVLNKVWNSPDTSKMSCFAEMFSRPSFSNKISSPSFSRHRWHRWCPSCNTPMWQYLWVSYAHY